MLEMLKVTFKFNSETHIILSEFYTIIKFIRSQGSLGGHAEVIVFQHPPPTTKTPIGLVSL